MGRTINLELQSRLGTSEGVKIVRFVEADSYFVKHGLTWVSWTGFLSMIGVFRVGKLDFL